jgi:pre-mRNA-splicing factor 38A
MDEFADQLLHEERVCDIILPRLAKREVLEDAGEVGPRKSRLLDVMEGNEDEKTHERSRSRSAGRSANISDKSGSVESGRYVSRSPSRSPSRSRSRSRSGSVRFRSRSRSISQDRMDTDAG